MSGPARPLPPRETMAESLAFEDIARYPRPGMDIPRQVTFTPGGKQIAYLQSRPNTLVQDLWLHTITDGKRRRVAGPVDEGASAEQGVTLEDELLRERRRIRELGITGYQFAGGAEGTESVALVPLNDRLYLATGDGPLIPIPGSEGAIEARLSPDGSHVAFVLDGDLYVVSANGGAAPRRLTSGARDGVTNGVAEYIAEEEMGRHEGYWWSPDSTRLAFIQADSSHIPIYSIAHQGTDSFFVEEHRYPFAGGRNARVRLGVLAIDADAEQVTWMDLGEEDDIYLARVAWRNAGALTAIVQARDQRSLRLVELNPAGGTGVTVIEEQGEPWLNLHDATRFLKSGEILWASEKTGFRHLYLHAAGGRESRALTSGEWMVTSLAGLDEAQRIVYFLGTRDGATERRLYAVSLDGGELRRLTEEEGWHEAVISPDFRYWLDTWSSPRQAPRLSLRRMDDGMVESVLFENAEVTPQGLGLCVPELTHFTNSAGVLLHAAVYASEDTRTGGARRPLIVSVYGGPHAQMVTNNWALTIDLRAQYLAQQGYVVLKVDNRGSANRGLAFEAPLAANLGQVEVQDQVEGVRFLAERPYVDGERTAVYGWSYGGYMTLRLLLLAPDVFKAGIAGAPVTAWEGYDSHYTERYMGSPVKNAAAYQASSVLAQVSTLRGRLLLIHGMVDENVHFRHTARLITALIQADKSYEAALFPEERHMPRRFEDLVYLERRLVEFLRTHME